ncbi:unnamed protein product [Caenorhabditis angaria]|uniref:Uncharacterized protein n=1 Tax=Caenorhabditis angaria TaxID=860376 RepID=A0A9P1I708_9PELO|nr:unnamed protein product [Caenorhabditis angaria]
MSSYLIYKYGVLVKRREKKWMVAIIGEKTDNNKIVRIRNDLFGFPECLGDIVKIGVDLDEGEVKKVVKCNDEWVRDVEIRGELAIIYIFVNLCSEKMERVVRSDEPNSRKEYYIFGSDGDSDFHRVAIAKSVVDRTLSNRNVMQKAREKIIYRVGVVYQPQTYGENESCFWKHEEETELLPIFECFSRDSVVPFVNPMMIYGVLDGIVIRSSAEMNLFWSRNIGCAILQRDFSKEFFKLGDVCDVLYKRCIPDTSFNFPCTYDIFGAILNRNIPSNFNIYKNVTHDEIYIETTAKCCVLPVTNQFFFELPILGRVFDGISSIWCDYLESGKVYSLRIAFEMVENGWRPVVKDILVPNLISLKCRIVLLDESLGICYAIIDPDVRNNLPHLHGIVDFIAISPRVLYCSGVKPGILQDLVDLKIRPPNMHQQQQICEAVNISQITKNSKVMCNDLRKVMGKIWIRSTAKFHDIPSNGCSPITLKCRNLPQFLVDSLMITERFLQRDTVAVNAECVLNPWNRPCFLIRHCAQNLQQLEKLIPQNMQNLIDPKEAFDLVHQETFPNLRTIFENRENLDLNRSQNVESDDNTIVADGEYRVAAEIDRNNMDFDRMSLCSRTNRTYYSEIKSYHTQSIYVPETILDEREFEKRISELEELELDETQPSTSSASFPSQFSNSNSNWAPRNTWNSNPNSYGPQRSLFGNTAFQQTYRHFPKRKLKIGIREPISKNLTDEEFIYDVIYRNLNHREMYSPNDYSHILRLWSKRIAGRLDLIKRKTPYLIPIEMRNHQKDWRENRTPFKLLVRFFAINSDVDVKLKNVFIPVGGQFAELPDGFEMGKMMIGLHFSSFNDPLIRIGGYGEEMGQVGLAMTGPEMSRFEYEEVGNGKGLKWIRIKAKLTRPAIQIVPSQLFELWTSQSVQGLVIVETNDLVLDDLEPETMQNYEMEGIIEPLPGAPYSIKSLLNIADDCYLESNDYIIFWRLVTTFRGSNSKPTFIKANPIPPPRSPGKPMKFEYTYGEVLMEHLRTVQKLTQERVDRLRANGDPRVRIFDGPELPPQMKARKVHVDIRKARMMAALERLKLDLDMCHEAGIFETVTKEQIQKLLDKFEEMTDDFHSHTVLERRFAIKNGTQYLLDLLMVDGMVKKMQFELGEKIKDLLLVLVDCIDLNNTYIVKTDDVQRMLVYFDDQHLISSDD